FGESLLRAERQRLALQLVHHVEAITERLLGDGCILERDLCFELGLELLVRNSEEACKRVEACVAVHPQGFHVLDWNRTAEVPRDVEPEENTDEPGDRWVKIRFRRSASTGASLRGVDKGLQKAGALVEVIAQLKHSGVCRHLRRFECRDCCLLAGALQ